MRTELRGGDGGLQYDFHLRVSWRVIAHGYITGNRIYNRLWYILYEICSRLYIYIAPEGEATSDFLTLDESPYGIFYQISVLRRWSSQQPPLRSISDQSTVHRAQRAEM